LPLSAEDRGRSLIYHLVLFAKILAFCLAICCHLIGLWGEDSLRDTGNLSNKRNKQRGKGAVAQSNN
jgi:hypothetical protein